MSSRLIIASGRKLVLMAISVWLLTTMIFLNYFDWYSSIASMSDTDAWRTPSLTSFVQSAGSTNCQDSTSTHSVHPADTIKIGKTGITHKSERHISCQDVDKYVSDGIWVDPNEGKVLARHIQTNPDHKFHVFVHIRAYDNVRYKSIYKEGDYYEIQVMDRFKYILSEHKCVDNNNDVSTTPRFCSRSQRPLVVDVGGNIGYYTLMSAAWQHDVITFEINPANIIRICESVRWNTNFENQVRLYRQGVSNVTGAVIESDVSGNPGAVSLNNGRSQGLGGNENKNRTSYGHEVENQGAKSFSVMTVQLDEFANERGWLEDPTFSIALLKIDTEGHEPQVLAGAQRLIQSGKVKNILIEYRPSYKAISDSLLDAGYVIVDDGSDKNQLLSRTESETILREKHLHIKEYVDLWFRLSSLPLR